MSGSVGQYTQGWLPFMANKSSVPASWTRAVRSDMLGMDQFYNNGAVNDYVEWDAYLDTGTWKIAIIHEKRPDGGIFSLQLDGGTVGTIDSYAAGATPNNYAEVTGISITGAGVKALRLSALSKNASSSSYYIIHQSIALIRTSGTGSTPSGSDTPGYTWQTLGWTGTKSNTGWATRTQGSAELGGGRLDTDTTALNNLFTDDVWMDTGTYKVALVRTTNTDQGIYNITGINGTQTVDGYAALASNVYTEVTGIAVATAGTKTVQVQMATKNASSSAYGGKLNALSWVRTGA